MLTGRRMTLLWEPHKADGHPDAQEKFREVEDRVGGVQAAKLREVWRRRLARNKIEIAADSDNLGSDVENHDQHEDHHQSEAEGQAAVPEARRGQDQERSAQQHLDPTPPAEVKAIQFRGKMSQEQAGLFRRKRLDILLELGGSGRTENPVHLKKILRGHPGHQKSAQQPSAQKKRHYFAHGLSRFTPDECSSPCYAKLPGNATGNHPRADMIFDTKRHPRTETLVRQAVRRLSEADPVLGGLIRQVGPCGLGMTRRNHYFAALVEAIIYQQLTAKAAARILARFRSLYPSRRFPAPEDVERTPESDLRGVGLSSQKISYVKDLARQVRNGSFPLQRLSAMDDAELIRRLTEIKGIGHWTAEMFLIFCLGRPDVLPTTDLGIRKAVQKLYSLPTLPSSQALEQMGERWQPYRSVAAWYLWASADRNLPGQPE